VANAKVDEALCCCCFAVCDPFCSSIGCNVSGGGLCDGPCLPGYGLSSIKTCIGECEWFDFVAATLEICSTYICGFDGLSW
jgi:hypothetical protein